jgi:hypothetical protein
MGKLKTDLVINAKDFFRTTVEDAFKEKRLSSNVLIKDYKILSPFETTKF